MNTKIGRGPAPGSPAVCINTLEQARARRAGLVGPVALVPTMGALHQGHLEHIRVCREWAEHVFVSVFVNPTQFGPHEHYDRYPRTLQADIERCAEAGAAGVFAPSAQQLYPPGVPDVTIQVPKLGDDLEGRSRPGHFQGVCRVVAKLLNIFQPDYVSFGQKDYQQLRIIQAMVDDLMIPVRILEVQTVREPDGLAMSSRNRNLDAKQRQQALGLYKALLLAKKQVEQEAETDPDAVAHSMRSVMRAHQVQDDYAVLRHPKTLNELTCIEPDLTGGVVALLAGKIGSARLIDNMLLGGGGR